MKKFKYKTSMAVELDQSMMDDMAEDGWFYDKSGTPLPPSVNKDDMSGMFQTPVEMPRYYKFSPDFVVEINNQEYLITDVDNEKFIVKAINLETKQKEVFRDFSIYSNVVFKAKEKSMERVDPINKEIDYHNKRTEEAGLNRATQQFNNLPLQINRLYRTIYERINILNEMIDATKEKIVKAKHEKPESIKKVEDYVKSRITSGELNESEFKDHVLSSYVYHYDLLVEDLRTGALVIPDNIPNPDTYKEKLISMGELAFEKYVEDKNKDIQKNQYYNLMDQNPIRNLKNINIDHIPTSTSAEGYSSYEGYIKSLYAKVMGMEKDKKELIQAGVKLQETISATKAVREEGLSFSKESLGSEKGKQFLQSILDLLNSAEVRNFVQRYSDPIVDDDGNIDSKKMGRNSSSLGNMKVALAFLSLSTVIKKYFDSQEISPYSIH